MIVRIGRMILSVLCIASGLVAAPAITWSPSNVTATALIGTVTSVQATFTSSEPLTNVGVSVVPGLSKLVSVAPATFVSVQPGVPQSVRIQVEIPKGTPPGSIQGTLHLVDAAGRKTYAQPLPVIIVPVQPTLTTIPPSVALPSADRIAVTTDGGDVRFVNDELIVHFKRGTSTAAVQQVAQAIGGTFLGSIPDAGMYQILVPPGSFESLSGLISIVRGFPAVALATHHSFRDVLALPDDPYTKLSPAPGLIKLPQAWGLATGAAGVPIGIIDSVFDFSHPDLFGNIAGHTENSAALSATDHGTRVASIVGAIGNNGKGIAGVLWTASLHLYSSSMASNPTVLDDVLLVSNIKRAVDDRVRIINGSFAMECTYSKSSTAKYCSSSRLDSMLDQDNVFRLYMERAKEAKPPLDVLWVFAAGNAGVDLNHSSPARLSIDTPNVISVSATDNHSQRASFSNYGQGITVAAPGVNVYSDIPGGGADNGIVTSSDGMRVDTGLANGTSFAAPFVTGVAGLMLSVNKNLTAAQLKDITHNTAQHTSNYDPEGNEVRLVDAYAAVQQAVDFGSGINTGTWTELFDHAPDYSNKWVISAQTGVSTVTYTPSNFRIQSPPVCTSPTSGTSVTFRSKQAFTGDLDAIFQLDHAGSGRTQVGLWSANQNQGLIWSILDTDDTNYLNLISGGAATDWKYAGSPYMNRWITLRIQVVGSQVNFYADGTLLQTWPVPASYASDAYYIALNAGSVCWKSGGNDTSFRSVSVTGTQRPGTQQ